MPLKIPNYGDWGGDGVRGYHPPACTCYRCNEERRRVETSKEEERRVAEYDRRVAENQKPTKDDQNKRGKNKPTRPGGGQSSPRTTSQRRAAEAVDQSVAGARPVARARTNVGRSTAPREESKALRMSRAVTASAIRYALALHVAAIVGLAAYGLVQGGTSNVMPTLNGATTAYVQAWNTMGAMIGLG